MTRYSHPIEAEVLWASPEMRLRHPAEDPKTLSVNRYDEGNGCGYENGSPDAYVERWVEVGTGAADVLTWFVERFLGPMEAIRSKVGPIIFEFSKFYSNDYERGADFIADMDRFFPGPN